MDSNISNLVDKSEMIDQTSEAENASTMSVGEFFIITSTVPIGEFLHMYPFGCKTLVHSDVIRGGAKSMIKDKD